MSHITGIGGFFFRGHDPKKLKDWYIETLGIDIQNYVWNQQAGPTVFEPFAKDNDYFSKDKPWMINLRVDDLAGLIVDLQAKCIDVEQKDEWNASPELGLFARIHDPEGNPIELWQPAKE